MLIRSITTSVGLADIRGAWQELERQKYPRNPFLTWEFMNLWWRHYGRRDSGELFVLAGFKGPRLVGIAPCQVRRIDQGDGERERLGFLGDNIVAPDFLDFITTAEHGEEFMQRCAALIRSERIDACIELNGIADETAESTRWRQFRQSLGLQAQQFEACPRILLPDDWESYLQSLSPGWRRSLMRKQRRMSKHVPHRIEVHSGHDAVGNLLRFIALNTQRLRSRGIDGGFVDDEFMHFHLELARTLAPREMIELHLLKADSGEDIAGNYFFKDPKSHHYYYYQQGFDARFGIYSPGNILTAGSIQVAIGRSAKEFHFLRGEEAYKYRWAPEAVNLVSLQDPDR